MRMLPHINDGMLITRRKIFATARLIMNKSSTMNVSALAGRVRSDMHHHHGDAAITDSIIKMGQEFFPRVIPLLLGSTIAKGFGSRKHGGHNMAQPRYLEVKQNIKITDFGISCGKYISVKNDFNMDIIQSTNQTNQKSSLLLFFLIHQITAMCFDNIFSQR